jgi:hypothetical protein
MCLFIDIYKYGVKAYKSLQNIEKKDNFLLLKKEYL